jgi:NTP pyrophosphatase (non-canonical NTP hydrolase)
MKFSEYQGRALKTDQVPDRRDGSDNHIVVPLLGMAGEVGSLLVEYKKLLRDGPAHKLFEERMTEELGDALWYIANLASKCGVSLEQVAKYNLSKTDGRWSKDRKEREYLDKGYPATQQFPRTFDVVLRERGTKRGEVEVEVRYQGRRIGSTLQDNAYVDDGYRYHDVFHLAYVAVLGWSPVIRGLMGRKRKKERKIDMVEDGGRASAIDEALVAFVFDYARKHYTSEGRLLEGVKHLDCSLLTAVRSLVSCLEVKRYTAKEWEDAILQGFSVWRDVVENKGGKLHLNLRARRIEYLGRE